MLSSNTMKRLSNTAITRDVFNSWLSHDKDMLNVLEDLDIETSTKYELFDMLDVDMGGELDFGELVDGIMRVRGPIAKCDIVATRLGVRHMTKLLERLNEHAGCK